MEKIGNWLWHGGRVRVVKPITTNGGKAFEAGEVLRLRRLEPLGGDSDLASAHFESERDPEKGLILAGWQLTEPGEFEFLAD